MNPLEKTAFTWVTTWVLIDSFFPNAPSQDKFHACAIATLSIAYLYGVHLIVMSSVKSLFLQMIAVFKK